MKTILKSIICIVILFLSGCQKNNHNVHDSLIGNTWILVKVVHTDTNLEELVPGNLTNMNIVFNNNLSLHALGACNSLDGDYSILSNDSIKIDNLGRTKMYCGNEINMTWEDIFYNSLKNATNFDITGDRLIIKSISNISLIFKPN
jgi:heat shock protein HslJ